MTDSSHPRTQLDDDPHLRMQNTAVLRRATNADAAALTRIFIATRTQCWEFLEWTYDFEVIRSLFAERWIPGRDTWVGEVGCVLAGYMSVVGTELEALYVLPNWHGRGVADQLLGKARELSPNELWLWAFQKNLQARRFYEKHGFVLDHETDGQGNMEKEPDARYVWRAPTR